MQHHAVSCYGTTIVLNCVDGHCGIVIQSDFLEIHTFVVDSYQYNTIELLEKRQALTELLEIIVSKNILVFVILCPIHMHCVITLLHRYIFQSGKLSTC